MKKPKIHFRSLRFANNAGMNFPECYANPLKGLLDLDRTRLKTTGDRYAITCKRCNKVIGNKFDSELKGK